MKENELFIPACTVANGVIINTLLPTSQIPVGNRKEEDINNEEFDGVVDPVNPLNVRFVPILRQEVKIGMELIIVTVRVLKPQGLELL